MNINRIAGMGFLLAGVAAMPVMAIQHGAETCPSSPVTAKSYSWDFHTEAANLLTGIQQDAMKARSHADQLTQEFWDPNLDWHAFLAELRPLKAEINDIGAKLCRLDTIRSAESPWEQRATDRTTLYAKEMAMNAQQAILFVNNHHADLQNPAFDEYSKHISSESGKLSRMIGEYEKLANLSHEERELHGELHGTARS